MDIGIAVDVGGTFTDIVVLRGDGEVATYKAPTTPEDVTDGVFDGLSVAAADLALTRAELLDGCAKLAFGTTTATNAILEGRAARAGLIVTRGFRETLLVREGGKTDTYRIAMDYPAPYVPRALTAEVTERVNSEGGIETPLDEEDARAAIQRLRDLGVEAIAVSLLWSIANPAHERRLGEIVAEVWPEVPVSLGHQVNPCIREYRRTSATALDASLKPIVGRSVRRLRDRLAAEGFGGTLTYVTSNGGQTSAEEIAAKPVYLCFSGPSAAPEAGRRLGALEEVASGNLVTVDMGGTSFDVSVISDWAIPMHREGTIAGHLFGVPSVAVHTIGAGGGSIARVDAGGFVHAGPESARSVPGPACYGHGGTAATVTDANLVRGLLDPDYFAGGSMALEPERAREAIARDVAEPLGIGTLEAASLVTLTCEQNMVGAIQDITIKQGIDPRDYTMVAGGAAAGLHAVAIARELGMARIIVPRMAGVLSAFGILTSDVTFNYGRAFFAASDGFDFSAVNAVLAALEGQARSYLARMGFAPGAGECRFSVEARYAGQVWQLTVPLARGRIEGQADLDGLVEGFHQLHESLYAVRGEGEAVEFTEWNARAVGRLPDVAVPEADGADRDLAGALKTRRPAYFHELGREVETPVFSGDRLPIGARIEAPAIIEEPLTTIVVHPGSSAVVTRFGNYVLSLGERA